MRSMWLGNFGTISAFAYRQRETRRNLCQGNTTNCTILQKVLNIGVALGCWRLAVKNL